ncbi:MAG: KxYKxGKxW signal peptide domain-containing protein [Rhizobacter sp.]
MRRKPDGLLSAYLSGRQWCVAGLATVAGEVSTLSICGTVNSTWR